MAILVDCPFSAESGFVGFNMGAEANGITNVPVNDGRLVVVPDHIEIAPAPDGTSAYRATIYPSDQITRLGIRSEISHGRESVHANGGGEERWYRVEVYFPSSSIGPDWCTLMQIHDTPDDGENPVKFMNFIIRTKDGFAHVLIPADMPNEISAFRSPPGRQVKLICDRWVTLALHTNFSNSNNGFMEFWYDGVLMTREWSRPYGYNDVVGPFWKVGIYDLDGNHGANPPAKIYQVWYRNAKVYGPGHTAEEVLGVAPRNPEQLLVSAP